MVVLTGKSLGERQRDLNNKVAEVIANKTNFNDIKLEEEVTDVDKLYKIDIASHYKDVDYIIEVLKSGDSLYISRALKCPWLYHDNYNHIINAEYLHENIFPFMSIKMKKKMLSTISIHIRNSERAADYFIYCQKNQMPNVAFKFLNISSEEFKMNVLKNKHTYNLYSYIYMPTHLQNFVGNSFELAITCIEIFNRNRSDIIHHLRYLYAINNIKYLDILENSNSYYASERFGIRISRDIMLKHKNRVLKNPLLYINKLNKTMLVKYTSKCEAKKYIISLFPLSVKEFWQIDFCTAYSYILNLIPMDEKFEFIKQLFTTNYPEEVFEMSVYFYKLKYYTMLSNDQKELWALRHIEEQKEILGDGNDYIWYKFVNIDKALVEINKCIMVTSDVNKRSCIVNILVEAARDQKDLKRVLDYYYERHINEKKTYKCNFIDKVLHVHNVFEFNIECWNALNKLFHSLDIYGANRYTDSVFVAVAVICHILHNMEFPQALLNFVDLDVNYSYFSILLQKLSKEKSEIVLQYLLKLHVDKLKPFEQDPYNKNVSKKLMKYVNNIFNLLACFNKKDEDCPAIVKKFMDIHAPKPKQSKTVTSKALLGFIKRDATLAIDVLDRSDINITDYDGTVNSTLKKIKVYFHNDVGQAYINFLERIIHKSSYERVSHDTINAAVFGIFILGDQNYKTTFIEKYKPSAPKIDHGVINRCILDIQEAICKFMAYSRPPLPLEQVLQYIKGDYVHYCLPMFNKYLVNLTLPQVIKFTEGILNKPLSIQKHGLRLAFETYSTESLKMLLLNTWKKSKNVSLRKIIYKSLHDKLLKQKTSGDNDDQVDVLYEAIKFCTSDLHQDDDEDLFQLISSCRLPNKFIDDYLQTAWLMAIKLPKKSGGIQRQIKIINSIDNNITLIQRDFIRKSIIDEHVHEMLENRRLRPDELPKLQDLWDAKWKLIANYVVRYRNNDELEQSLALVTLILTKCIEMWDDSYEETWIFQDFFFEFLTYVEKKSYIILCNNPEEACNVPIFEHILDMLQKALPLKKIYLIVWNLKVTIFLRLSLSVTNTLLRDVKDAQLKREEILSVNLANHIQNFVQELLLKDEFYLIYLPKIARLLIHKLQVLKLQGMKHMDIILSQSFMNIGLKETHLLALMILPTNVPEKMREIHTGILKKIQTFENDEIQSFLYFKFFSSYNMALSNYAF